MCDDVVYNRIVILYGYGRYIYIHAANFLQTNIRYVQPLLVEADYLSPEEDGGVAITVALTAKLREGAYEGRRRAVAQ